MTRISLICLLTLSALAFTQTVSACPPGSDAVPPNRSPDAIAPDDAVRRGFGEDFSHLISVASSNYDSDCNPWLTPDETELFFIRLSGLYGPADPGYQGSWDIYHCDWDPHRRAWGPATNLGPNVNTTEADRRPTTTVTGDTLFFSRHPFVYYSIRTAGEFGPATQLFRGSDPCLSSNSQRLYFVRESDIWFADRGPSGDVDDWVDLQSVGPPVNTGTHEVRPYISRDDSLLFFSDFGNPRPGGYGDADLWVSRWTGAAWDEPENVGPPINVDRPACTPWLSADGTRLYASSESSEGSRGVEDVWIAFRDASPPPAGVDPPPGTWTKLGELPGAWNVYDLVVDRDGRLFAATLPAARVYRSEDGGATWTETAPLPGARIAYSLLATSNGLLFAGTYPLGDVFRSLDHGDSWELTANLPGALAVRALLETTDGRVLAGTSPLCRIFQTTNNGLAWQQLGDTNGMKNSVSCLFETSAGTLFAGGWGRPNVSNNGGQSWVPFFEFAGMGSVESFIEASDGTLWLTGWGHDEGEIIAWSDDGGLGWTLAGQVQVDSVLAVRVYDIVETDDGDLMVGFQPGPHRVAALSTDSGLTWVPEGALAGAHEILRFLKLTDGTIYAATTPNGDIFRWTPGTTGVATEDVAVARSPGVAAVLGGVPNPFRAETAITYQVPVAGEVALAIVDAQGRHVRTLVLAGVDAGLHRETWDGTDESGTRAPSGIYFAKLRAGESVSFQKVALVR
jgi:hypothetical protein